MLVKLNDKKKTIGKTLPDGSVKVLVIFESLNMLCPISDAYFDRG